jgi:hypothetical protein
MKLWHVFAIAVIANLVAVYLADYLAKYLTGVNTPGKPLI